MPYEASITRQEPAAILFLLDQSGSMDEALANGKSKCQQLADTLNRSIANLVQRCARADGVRDYFYLGGLAYGQGQVRDAFDSLSGKSVFRPISEFAERPKRVDERKKLEDDGAGGIFERVIKFPIWHEPYASGDTPMCQALYEAARAIVEFCDAHPNSYPPTVLHITDGEANDGDPEAIAEGVKQLHTNDGNVLLFSLHLSPGGGQALAFPREEADLANNYARMLFRMSSELPKHLLAAAKERRHKLEEGARGFMFNAEAVEIAEFFDIGTRPANMG